MPAFANIGSLTFSRILTAACSMACDEMSLSAAYKGPDDWVINGLGNGYERVARVQGGAVVVTDDGALVGNFESEEYLGHWLIGEAL